MANLVKIQGGKVFEHEMMPFPGLTIYDGETLVKFPYTNDRDLHLRYGELADASAQNPLDDSDAAIVVGSGAVTSLAPVLPSNIWFTDYSPHLLSWMDHQIKRVASCESADEFGEWLTSTYPSAWSNLAVERLNLGDHHLLSDDTTFRMAQEALGNTTFHYVQIDYRDKEALHALGEMIDAEGEQVRVMNLTNVHTHVVRTHEPTYIRERMHRLADNLQVLPLADEAMIFASGRNNGPMDPLPTARTVDEYEEICAVDLINRVQKAQAKLSQRLSRRAASSRSLGVV